MISNHFTRRVLFQDGAYIYDESAKMADVFSKYQGRGVGGVVDAEGGSWGGVSCIDMNILLVCSGVTARQP